MSTRRVLWRQPEWWSVTLAGGAWLVMIARSAADGDHPSHAAPIVEAVTHWTLMVVAAMVPTLIDPIREVAGRSFWHRRHRAVAVFLAGYVSVWLLFGVVVMLSIAWLPADFRLDLVPIALVIAAAWQLSPVKWRAVMACHRRIALAPSGWPAARDCLRQGWAIGRPCLAACGPMMTVCVLTHDVRLMAAVAAVGWLERAAFRPRPYPAIAILITLAAITALPL